MSIKEYKAQHIDQKKAFLQVLFWEEINKLEVYIQGFGHMFLQFK